jgi:hypothetical protein
MESRSQIKAIAHIPADNHGTGDVVGTTPISVKDNPTFVALVHLGDEGAAGTLDAHLEYRETAGSGSWLNDDGSTGNVHEITQLTAAGDAQLYMTRPMGEEYRVVLTVGTNAVDAACFVASLPYNLPVSYS